MKVEKISGICASQIKWNQGFGVAHASDLFGTYQSYPEIMVKSPKTGSVKKFTLNQEEAIENEFWDGEFVILRDEDKEFAIKVWND